MVSQTLSAQGGQTWQDYSIKIRLVSQWALQMTVLANIEPSMTRREEMLCFYNCTVLQVTSSPQAQAASDNPCTHCFWETVGSPSSDYNSLCIPRRPDQWRMTKTRPASDCHSPRGLGSEQSVVNQEQSLSVCPWPQINVNNKAQVTQNLFSRTVWLFRKRLGRI